MENLILASAGLIGIGTATVHGILTDRLMAKPVDRLLGDGNGSATIRRLVPLLLQYSSYNWLLGGITLIAVACGWQPAARLAVSLLVGSAYLYGAAANAWGTRGRHPGWMLMAAAVGLIAVDIARQATP